jgi:hypothetical protein
MRNALQVLRWLARIGSLVSYFVMVLYLVGEGFTVSSFTFNDWVGFICFPVGALGGQLVGWWNELVGGIITTVSLLAFYLIYGLLLHIWPTGPAYIVFSIPGFIFLVAGILKYYDSKNEPRSNSRVS